MEICIPLDIDSNASFSTAKLIVRRGINRPKNVVLHIDDGDRQIEVPIDVLLKALGAI